MSLASAKAAFVAKVITDSAAGHDAATAIGLFADAVISLVNAATVTVPATGIISANPGVNCTGSSTTGTLT